MKQDDIRYWGNNEPVCPHCDAEQTDAWDYGWDYREDEELEEMECQKCEKLFDVQLVISYAYTTEKSAE